MQSLIRKFSIVVGACAALGACSDSTGAPAGMPVSISFSTSPTAGASASRMAAGDVSGSITATVGADTLVITRVQVVVARMELQRVGATCASAAAAGDDNDSVDANECAELELAPSVVELPVDASVVSALSLAVPAGTYSALEAKIRPVRADGDHGPGSSAFLTAHPELSGVSVRVEGTFDKQAFVFTGSPRAQFETRFNPAITVDAAPVNVTVHADLTTWFRNSSGALINPTTANPGGPNAATVSDNIRRSFRAFRDNNRNGHDDDNGHDQTNDN